MPCHLVAATGFALSVPLGGAGLELPVGSVVQDAPIACATGVGVEVRVSHDTYGRPAPVGARGCVPEHLLSPLDDCSVRPVDPDTLAGLVRVRDTYAEHFGQIALTELGWTDWGYVSLPLRDLTADELAAEWAREGLVTPVQREKAVVAVGPAYVHFLGADAPGTDVWATPTTVEHLLRLSSAWSRRCTAPACTIQIGDLAWYNAQLPDPLGHRDHNEGACVDIRLFRTDGARYEAWWNKPDDRTGTQAYDRARTTDFLTFAIANAPVTTVYFNDPAVIAAVPGLRAAKGHDDHIHMCFAS